MFKWLTWLGRSEEKDRAYARLETIRQQYGDEGARVIKLSARTDMTRSSAGSTLRAFSHVEQAFAEATQEYARMGELFETLNAGLEQGKVGDFAQAESILKALGTKLNELERLLTSWDAQWQQVPLELDNLQETLVSMKLQSDQAAAHVGAPLPVSIRVEAMEQHLGRVKQTLASGNPVEAGHQLADLRLAMERVSEDLSLYLSGAGAISQVEQDIIQIRERHAAVGDTAASGEAIGALAAAEAVVPRLKSHLVNGKLEHFQQDLLQVQKNLSAARSSLKS